MSQPNKPINLSVHQSSDPSLISSNPNVEASGASNDLNDSAHDDENVDVPQQPLDDNSDENITHSQTSTANISAG